jgi:hypothetical protein
LDDAQPASWNEPGASIPAAPKLQAPVNPRCQDQVRPPQSDEGTRVHDQGWDLIGAFQGGWQMIVIRAAASYDGMCRPLQYQDFVFVRGTFAGTLSPQPMDSRTDGALIRVTLQGQTRLTADYLRYTAADPLCCASRTTTVVFDIPGSAPAVRPISATTTDP